MVCTFSRCYCTVIDHWEDASKLTIRWRWTLMVKVKYMGQLLSKPKHEPSNQDSCVSCDVLPVCSMLYPHSAAEIIM